MILWIILIAAGIIVLPLLCLLLVFAYQRVVLGYKIVVYFGKYNIEVDIIKNPHQVDHAFYGVWLGNPSEYTIEWDVKFRPDDTHDDVGGAMVIHSSVHKFSFGYLLNYASE